LDLWLVNAFTYHSNSSRNLLILLSYASSIKIPFSSNTLCTLGIANDEGIAEVLMVNPILQILI
jgi:hypothetical protein